MERPLAVELVDSGLGTIGQCIRLMIGVLKLVVMMNDGPHALILALIETRPACESECERELGQDGRWARVACLDTRGETELEGLGAVADGSLSEEWEG